MSNEPEIYKSDSGESKYSNEDREQKDHFAQSEPAILNAMRKYKNATKIKQINQMQGIDNKTSHLVNYLDQVNKKGLPPKGLGMIHRRGETDEIRLCGRALDQV